jgi:hypothetical protein
MGVNVVELDGWQVNEPGYFWVTPGTPDVHHGYGGLPNGWMWHHTASASYTPYVKNQKGQTKANLWMGLLRGERLHHSGGGTPTVVLASGGPADYSSGSGRRTLLEEVIMVDRRFPGPQRQADDEPEFFGNRYYGNTEIVHPGHGEPLDPGVWEVAVTTAELMCRRWGWSPWRHVGHYDHTSRKVDIRFQIGSPYSIAPFQDQIHNRLGGETPGGWLTGGMLARATDGETEVVVPARHWTDDIADDTWTRWYKDGHIKGDASVMPGYYFAGGAATTGERIHAFNTAMRSISKRTRRSDGG